jgi:hypothetical protein
VFVVCAGVWQAASKQEAAEASSTATNTVTPTKLPAFFTPPKQLPGGVGTVIKYERVAAPGIDGTSYLVMYVSEDEQGHDIPVVASVRVPRGRVPKGGFPVIAVAHPTSGIARMRVLARRGYHERHDEPDVAGRV